MSKDYTANHKIKVEAFKDLLLDEGLHEDLLFKIYDILDEISEHETMFIPYYGNLIWLAWRYSETYRDLTSKDDVDEILSMEILFYLED